jgi:hypothetical protein
VVRFELTSAAFNASRVATLDLAAIDPDLRGFSDGVVGGGRDRGRGDARFYAQ